MIDMSIKIVVPGRYNGHSEVGWDTGWDGMRAGTGFNREIEVSLLLGVYLGTYYLWFPLRSLVR